MAATPRQPTLPDQEHAERLLRALAGEVSAGAAAAAVLVGPDAVHGAVHAAVHGAPAEPTPEPAARDAQPLAEVIQLGWQFGGRAFEAGLSVHHVVRDADLLLAVVLADLERDVEQLPDDVDATPAAALAAARRLQRGMGRYTQAATSGFAHALLRGMRESYRLLRHDLRNPLGTIRSALSLMEDESVPAEMRNGPGIRSMVARNAGSLDSLIGQRLDDAAAAALLIPPQDIALRDVALAARREVREAARLAGCEVVVAMPAAPPAAVDSAALELTLSALLLAALAHAGPGDAVHIDCEDAPGGARDGRPCPVVRVRVVREVVRADRRGAAPGAGAPRWEPHGLALASALAADHGGGIGPDAEIVVGTDEVAALVHAEAIYIRLPEAGDGAAGGNGSEDGAEDATTTLAGPD